MPTQAFPAASHARPVQPSRSRTAPHWLLDRSIGFNRFVMNQLNERLSQFIAAREIDRLTHPDERVSRNLAAVFNPVLYPGVGELLRITQREPGYLKRLWRYRTPD